MKLRSIAAIGATVLALVATTASGESAGPKSVKDGKADSSSSSNGPGTKGSPAKVGATIQLSGTQYTVVSVRKATAIGGEFGQKADGTFVIVKLKIENKKSETKTFSESNTALIAKDGTSYDASDASMYLDDALFLQEMHPNLPHTGEIAFDVPAAVVATGVLKISDLWGDGDAYFQLK